MSTPNIRRITGFTVLVYGLASFAWYLVTIVDKAAVFPGSPRLHLLLISVNPGAAALLFIAGFLATSGLLPIVAGIRLLQQRRLAAVPLVMAAVVSIIVMPLISLGGEPEYVLDVASWLVLLEMYLRYLTSARDTIFGLINATLAIIVVTIDRRSRKADVVTSPPTRT